MFSILGVTILEQILRFLDGTMPTPRLYGAYHWLCLIIVLALCVFVAMRCRHLSEKKVRLTLVFVGVTLIIFETYKQLHFAYDGQTDEWSYTWYAFPFQFCSTPMYVMLTLAFLPNGKTRRALYAYLATYALFAGLVVMAYPGDVFTTSIGVNIQTMIHHGAMVVVGILLYATDVVAPKQKTIISALPVFLTLCAMALLANWLFERFGDSAQSFNMFFISPYEIPTLVVFDKLFQYLPYPFYLMTYIFGFTLAAFLVLLAVKLLHRKKQDTRSKI